MVCVKMVFGGAVGKWITFLFLIFLFYAPPLNATGLTNYLISHLGPRSPHETVLIKDVITLLDDAKNRAYNRITHLGHGHLEEWQIEYINKLSDFEYGTPTKKQVIRMTALGLAAREGQSQLVNLFLQWGANIYIRDKSGHTPLEWAIIGAHLKVFKSLIAPHSYGYYPEDYKIWTDAQTLLKEKMDRSIEDLIDQEKQPTWLSIFHWGAKTRVEAESQKLTTWVQMGQVLGFDSKYLQGATTAASLHKPQVVEWKANPSRKAIEIEMHRKTQEQRNTEVVIPISPPIDSSVTREPPTKAVIDAGVVIKGEMRSYLNPFFGSKSAFSPTPARAK